MTLKSSARCRLKIIMRGHITKLKQIEIESVKYNMTQIIMIFLDTAWANVKGPEARLGVDYSML